MSQRALFLMVVAGFAAMLCSGCSSSSSTDPAQATAKIRVVHASADLGTVDIYLGAATTPWIEDLEYLQTGTYLSINSPATITMVFRSAGDPADATPLFTSDDLVMSSGSSTSAVICGLIASGDPADAFRLIPYADSWLAHESGETRVRVVHAGADAGILTVVAAESAVLARNLPRFDASDLGGEPYPAALALDINVFMSGIAVASFHAPALDENKDYYFVITGLFSSAGAEAFTLLPVGPGGSLALEE